MAGTQPLYQKYGAKQSNPSALIQGQKAVGDSLKEALGGIEDLMKTQEQQYVERNTLNMQQHLKDSLQQSGLGADPVDTLAIKQKFGNLINMDQIDSTIKSTTEEMATNAIDKADGFAGQAFAETEDLAAAGNAFKQTLLNAGMNETKASARTQEWRNDNQFLVEDLKVAENKMLNEASNAMLKGIREGSDLESVTNELVDAAPEKLKQRLMTRLRTDYKTLSELTPEQLAEYEVNESRVNNQLDAAGRQLDLNVQQAKGAYDTIQVVPEGAYAAIDGMAAQLGGPIGQMGEDAQNGLFSGIARMFTGLFNDQVTGDAAASYIQNKQNQLIEERGLTPRDAAAISMQVYNDLKTSGSTGAPGTAFYETDIDERMNMYLGLHVQKQKALENYQKIQENAVKKRAAMEDQKLVLLSDLKKGERRSNVSGTPYGSEERFKASLFGNTGLPAEEPTTQEPASNKKDTPKKGLSIIEQTEADMRAETERNASRSQNSDPIDTATSFKESLKRSTPSSDEGGRLIDGNWVSQDQYASAVDEAGDQIMGAPITAAGKANAGLNQLANYFMLDPARALTEDISDGWNMFRETGQNWYSKGKGSKKDQNTSTEVEGMDGEKVTLSPVILQAMAKMPSTDIAAKEQAERIKKTTPKKDWEKVVKALEAGNPKLAAKLSKLLLNAG